MKSVKYTLAALAAIALASFSTAQAQITPNGAGDLVLGIFNSTNSLEFDLGAYSTLSNGETWDLQNIVSGSGVGSGLTFNIVAAGGGAGAGGLGVDEIVTTGTKFAASLPNSLSTENSAITTLEGPNAVTGGTNETPSGANYTAAVQSSGDAASFYKKYGTGTTQFGFGGNYTLGQSYTGSNSIGLYDLLEPNTTGTPESAVEIGTFTFTTTDGDTVLTYDSLSATPEPSAYALGLCAIALFWVLKRRSSTIA